MAGRFGAAAATIVMAALGVADGSAAVDVRQPVAVDWTDEAGLRVAPHETWGASEVDIDHDGDLDAWISRHGHGADLWRNNEHQAYVRQNFDAWPRRNSVGLVIDRHDCQWADVNRDGRTDTYCSTGRFTANVVKHGRDNEMWLNRGRGHFDEVGTAWGVGDVCGRGRHVVFLNVNGDRYPDLFLGNETPRDVADPCDRRTGTLPNESSKVFLNVAGTGFRYAPRLWHFGAGPGSRCAERMDFDGDGWPDLLTCRESGKPLALYRNQDGSGFEDATVAAGLERTLVNDADAVDLDGDGDQDVVIAAAHRFGYVLNTGGVFSAPVWVADVATGSGRAVAAGDADNDGDADLFGLVEKAGGNPDDMVLMNDGLAFSRLAVPSAGGVADEVVALHLGGGGRADFLVLNGRQRTNWGPLQLIRVQPGP